MVSDDLKGFMKYIFNFKEFITEMRDLIKSFFGIHNLRNLFMALTVVYFYIYLRGGALSKFFWGFLILAIIIHYRIVYLGGAHRGWIRKKKGIFPKKDLLRKEWSEEKGDENPKEDFASIWED